MAGLFAKKTINHYISDTIEVGFSQYGPTIMLGGILSSKSVALVDHMSASVLSPFNPVPKEFDWFAMLQDSKADLQFENIMSLSKFVISETTPYKYNILFVDNQRYAEMKTVLLNVSSAWQGFCTHSSLPRKELFGAFCKQPITRGLNDMLRSLSYWKAGEYKISVCITTKNDFIITGKYFMLNEDDTESIKNNFANIIANICNQQTANFITTTAQLYEK